MTLYIFARFYARKNKEEAVRKALAEVVPPSSQEPGFVKTVGPLVDHALEVMRAQPSGVMVVDAEGSFRCARPQILRLRSAKPALLRSG